MKKMKILLFGLPSLLIVMLVAHLIYNWIPVKNAIKIEDISQYPDCIIVKEAWHTGTGWELIGNENGYLISDDIKDVYLTGISPPTASIGGEYVNSYLCEVNYLGQDYYPGVGETELYDKYEVVEWFPIYPVKRDTLLPSWLYPQDYLSKGDKTQ